MNAVTFGTAARGFEFGGYLWVRVHIRDKKDYVDGSLSRSTLQN